MATSQNQFTVTLTADEAITKYRIVSMDQSSNNAKVNHLAASATDRPFGIATESAAADGDAVSVQVAGIGKVEANAAISGGQFLQSVADGRAAGADTVAAGRQAVGVALEDATAQGQIISCLILPMAATT